MLRTLMTSATGMEAQQLYMDTISNNLSNVNTVGFKRQKYGISGSHVSITARTRDTKR